MKATTLHFLPQFPPLTTYTAIYMYYNFKVHRDFSLLSFKTYGWGWKSGAHSSSLLSTPHTLSSFTPLHSSLHPSLHSTPLLTPSSFSQIRLESRSQQGRESFDILSSHSLLSSPLRSLKAGSRAVRPPAASARRQAAPGPTTYRII